MPAGADEQGDHDELPSPKRSGIEHIVVVMMENRSFDHFLGWLPGANGRQAGLSYKDSAGAAHPTYPLAPDYQGCAHPDPQRFGRARCLRVETWLDHWAHQSIDKAGSYVRR